MKWPQRVIIDECNLDKGPLMIRYFLTPKIFGVRLVLHKFLRSDHNRCFHDHPWNFMSFILKGSYIEHIPCSQTCGNKNCLQHASIFNYQWDIIKRPRTWKHWVEIPKAPVWTLVLLWGKRHNWGFWTSKGWVRHDTYDCRG